MKWGETKRIKSREFLPHWRLIKSLLLAGLRTDEIDMILISFEITSTEIEEIEEMREALTLEERDLAATNALRSSTGLPLTVEDHEFNDPRVGDNLWGMFVFGWGKKGRKMPSIYNSVMSIANNLQIRQYIECATLHGYPMSYIKSDIEKIIPMGCKTFVRFRGRAISLFMRFFWDISSKTLGGSGYFINDIYRYIDRDKHNIYWTPHRKLRGASEIDLDLYFGLIRDYEGIAKEILGVLSVSIKRDLNGVGVKVNRDYVALYKDLLRTLLESDKDNEATEKAVKEIESIIGKISQAKSDHLTLEELRQKYAKGIMDEESEIPKPVGDTP